LVVTPAVKVSTVALIAIIAGRRQWRPRSSVTVTVCPLAAEPVKAALTVPCCLR
jgi:hypothetical protein